MPLLPGTVGLAGLLFWAGQTMNALMPNATLAVAQTEGPAVWSLSGLGVPRYRRKRHISARDMNALLDYHNHIRASVHPPAANMEYMVSPRAFPGAPSGKHQLSVSQMGWTIHKPALTSIRGRGKGQEFVHFTDEKTKAIILVLSGGRSRGLQFMEHLLCARLYP